MGNENSSRWRGHQKKRTVEECRRISAREAQHVAGIATTTTPVATSAARRLWALCPECGARVWFLYQVPSAARGQAPDQAPDAGSAEQWKCRQCHGLAYKSAQQRGTLAAFHEWLNQDDQKNWREYAERHPAREWLYQRSKEAWDEICAPYDLQGMKPEKAVLLQAEMGGAEKVNRVFNEQRSKWSGMLHEFEQHATRWTMDSLKTDWKHQHRSNVKRRPGATISGGR